MLNCNKLRQIKSKIKIVEDARIKDARIIILKETARYLEIEKCNFYKIVKENKIHSLTDYFLGSGINFRYIQELLKHKNSKTVDIYAC
jgi:hypothetical protein